MMMPQVSIDATHSGVTGVFPDATPTQVDLAVAMAAAAMEEAADRSPLWWSQLLVRIADELAGASDQLVAFADQETSLGVGRLTSEFARTIHQLETYAQFVQTGEHLEATIDREAGHNPHRPDLRRVNVPMGPVAVFEASNFPLAFGVIGTDSAAALAAGCGVVAKVHPSHPATSQIAARCVRDALRQHGAPEGLFSLVHGASPDVAVLLVEHPQLRAVSFTGSTSVGRRLYDMCASRPEPIPVYAEMGSMNPVFLTRTSLEKRGAEIAEGLVASATLSGGQLCTKPGLVVVPSGLAGDRFIDALRAGVESVEPVRLLSPAITSALQEWRAEVQTLSGVTVVNSVQATEDGLTHPVVAVTDLSGLQRHGSLLEEHFGPFLLVVGHDDPVAIADRLHGALVATIHAEPGDDMENLVRVLQSRVGRVVWNGFPTGVAVARAMQHGGPYPAATFPGHTSVGTSAIRRFQRPVCFQGMPDEHLLPSLQSGNPWHLERRVDGELSSEPA